MLSLYTALIAIGSVVLVSAIVPWAILLEPFVDMLIAHARKHPYEHLGDYMERYWLLRPRRWFPLGILIQHILRSDVEPDNHDHPGPCASVPLRGPYIEMMPKDQGQDPGLDATHFVAPLRNPGDIILRGRRFRHRILLGPNCTCWSMFFRWRWPAEGPWGYYAPDAIGKYVDRRDYPAHCEWRAAHRTRRAA